MKSFIRIATASFILLMPALASAGTVVGGVSGSGGFLGFSWGNGGGAMGCTSTICGVAGTILYLINNVLVPVLFAIAFITFLYGVANLYIFQPDKVKDGHKLVLWGVVGFVIMISLWGLVNVVANTFGLQGSYAPELPTSYSS